MLCESWILRTTRAFCGNVESIGGVGNETFALFGCGRVFLFCVDFRGG